MNKMLQWICKMWEPNAPKFHCHPYWPQMLNQYFPPRWMEMWYIFVIGGNVRARVYYTMVESCWEILLSFRSCYNSWLPFSFSRRNPQPLFSCSFRERQSLRDSPFVRVGALYQTLRRSFVSKQRPECGMLASHWRWFLRSSPNTPSGESQQTPWLQRYLKPWSWSRLTFRNKTLLYQLRWNKQHLYCTVLYCTLLYCTVLCSSFSHRTSFILNSSLPGQIWFGGDEDVCRIFLGEPLHFLTPVFDVDKRLRLSYIEWEDDRVSRSVEKKR